VNLSVHMLARNGAMVVERSLRSVVGIADEVVLVDSCSSDDTIRVASDFCARSGIHFDCVELTPMTHPDLFLLDVPSTWRRQVPGPFTGLRVLSRFDRARNFGLELCRGKYVLKLDVDDEISDPRGIAAICKFLDANSSVDFVMCPYEIVDKSGEVVERVVYDRLWRNFRRIRFDLPVHEYLVGKCDVGHLTNWAVTTLGATRDWRDSTGEGSRIPNRNYKVFLAEYERIQASGEEVDVQYYMRFLTSTIREVEQVDLELAAEIHRLVGDVSDRRVEL
jgi:glycosyltransferase involved in cell wall biosynthesis